MLRHCRCVREGQAYGGSARPLPDVRDQRQVPLSAAQQPASTAAADSLNGSSDNREKINVLRLARRRCWLSHARSRREMPADGEHAAVIYRSGWAPRAQRDNSPSVRNFCGYAA